jgi:hypothetical protein
MVVPPNLDNKHPSMPFVFAAAAWLQEAWRRKGLGTLAVPPVCILDPDGDLVRRLRQTGVAKPFAGWPAITRNSVAGGSGSPAQQRASTTHRA